jgi:putative transposase
MPFLALHVVCSFLLDLLHVVTRSGHDQALELILLRQQLRLYERQAKQPRPSRWEKVALASLAARLPDLSRVCLVFTPATLLRWHREIVKRKWTFDNRPRRGRPPTSDACVELLLRLARENPRWGYGKLQGVYGLGTSSPPAVYADRGLLLADTAPARNAAGESRCS